MIDQQKIYSLAKRDPLAYGIAYIDLLEKRKWEVESRAWIQQIYKAVNPYYIEKYPEGRAKRLVIMKSTQCGMSTMGIVRAFHFADNWDVRIAYTLPRQQDVLDFVTTRVDPMINASPKLKDKRGVPDSVHSKRIGNSFLFFMEASVELRMMPIDSIYIDEVDLSNPDHIGTALNRLDASRWKTNYFFSTPTLPNFGIHAMYQNSDMRHWMVKCPRCNHWQELDWESNLRFDGPANKPKKVYYGCSRCNKELSLPQIQTGKWVPEHPDLTNQVIGYHVSQMMTTPAGVLYAHFRDPQQKLIEFYRKRLGKPYELGEGSLEREDFLVNCFDEPYDFEPGHDGKSHYYMGVDQGNQLQVIICKVPKDTRRPKIVHVELVDMDDGFRRVEKLFNLYKIRRAVIDGDPNRHPVIQLQKKYPGRVLAADYSPIKQVWNKGTKKQGNVEITYVTINRTTGFDSLMQSVKDGEWQLPGSPPNLQPMVELLIDHMTALKRDVETRRTSAGETEVGVWRKLRAEHLAHAWLYMKTAYDIQKGKGLRIHVPSREEEDPVEEVDETRPNDETIKGIVSFLAEVPVEQIQDLLTNGNKENYKIPFPLSYKLQRLDENDYTDEEAIEWVMWAFVEGRI